jgi:thiamine-phosphate pyrophosphorylase
MSLAPADAIGPLRRERMRTARLYFVCDARPRGEDPEPLLRAALSGGVDIVQLREKELDRHAIERSAATFRRLCDTYSVPVIVNDDPYLAHACDADGVHLGQDDAPVAEAREVLGSDAIVGLSTHTPEQVDAAAGVEDISAGPVWETPT